MTRFDAVMAQVRRRDPHEQEFHDAVCGLAKAACMALDERPDLAEARVLERLVEPERVVQFRVPWVDDDGRVQVHRGWRVEHSSALGPFKGGLRFRESVTLSVLKMLAFEQTFKNALTGLPLGAGKGGSDFHPAGRSDREVMAFCQSFMTELHRHLGPDTDVPAGDMGVGPREIGFLFGQYKRLRNRFDGGLTGKAPGWGGASGRAPATGYGLVYFLEEMLKARDDGLDGRKVLISGSGNVALAAADKVAQRGGLVVCLSDSDGAVVAEDGMDGEVLAWIRCLKEERRGRIREAAERFPHLQYLERGDGPAPEWAQAADIALPCATQNELNEADARRLVDHGVRAVAEGANLPCTRDAVAVLQEAGVAFGPAKAANAGGVAVSGLEMSQNAQHERWEEDRVLGRLHEIMVDIHETCAETAEAHGVADDLLLGADIAGFLRVGEAMLAQGVV